MREHLKVMVAVTALDGSGLIIGAPDNEPDGLLPSATNRLSGLDGRTFRAHGRAVAKEIENLMSKGWF